MVERNDHCIACNAPSLLLLCSRCRAKAEARKAGAAVVAATVDDASGQLVQNLNRNVAKLSPSKRKKKK